MTTSGNRQLLLYSVTAFCGLMSGLILAATGTHSTATRWVAGGFATFNAVSLAWFIWAAKRGRLTR